MSPIFREGSEQAFELDDLVGKPVQVDENTLKRFETEEDFSCLSFELYKETAKVLALCSHSLIGYGAANGSLGRDQAICAGLLVRISKFMTTVMQLLSVNPERAEVVLALNRCITESAISLRFLATKNEARFYNQFVDFSLGPERELYDLIMKNIAERGGKTVPIEERMLDSIGRVCKLSGVKIEDVRGKNPDWAGGLKNRLEALGEADWFVGIERVPSHAVHGTWVDLILHHLKEKDGGFAPDPSFSRVDSRLMLPLCTVVLEAAYSYLERFLRDHPDLKPLYQRIANLQSRIRKVDDTHEDWKRAGGKLEEA